jgi:hypothetical protein
MTKLQVDTIQGSDGTSAVDIKHGYTIAGSDASGTTQGVYTSETIPSNPSNGDLWRSAKYLYIYIENDWYQILQGSSVSNYSP